MGKPIKKIEQKHPHLSPEATGSSNFTQPSLVYPSSLLWGDQPQMVKHQLVFIFLKCCHHLRSVGQTPSKPSKISIATKQLKQTLIISNTTCTKLQNSTKRTIPKSSSRPPFQKAATKQLTGSQPLQPPHDHFPRPVAGGADEALSPNACVAWQIGVTDGEGFVFVAKFWKKRRRFAKKTSREQASPIFQHTTNKHTNKRKNKKTNFGRYLKGLLAVSKTQSCLVCHWKNKSFSLSFEKKHVAGGES